MNILYFIGNGFDINLGMKTRYSDFYEYYKSTESKTALIAELKKEIYEGIVNWSDLELAFGKYTSKLSNTNEFDEVYEDLVDNLADYLNLIEAQFDFNKVSSQKFFKNLSKPENSLTQEDIQELLVYRESWKNHHWVTNIITLNYTTCIEKIVGENISSIHIGSHHTNKIILKGIHHIHGYTDKRTILGVNDISQIDNTDFHENQEVLESLIKTNCNRTQRHNVDKLCESEIKKAQIICIFGSSIGETDNYWWQLIGEQLKRDTRIIIFSKGEEIKQRFSQKAARTKRAIKQLFLEKTSLSNEEKERLGEKIYIGVNTDMFDINF